MWFDKKDLTIKPIISSDDIHGYVLPHAGTSYTGEIISHTLRFRPTKKITKVIILYYPSTEIPDIDINDSNGNTLSYYHEYYVPWKSIDYFFSATSNTINYEGYNINVLSNLDINKIKQRFNILDTLIVVSSDFSHFLPFDTAIDLENKAAHSLMFRELQNSSYINSVDDIKTYRVFYKIIPNTLQLQWIGRTRSPGKGGVGYLSFLLKQIRLPEIQIHNTLPDGIFITVFDTHMNSRECMGNWYDKSSSNSSRDSSSDSISNNSNTWTLEYENDLVSKVVRLARTSSRLTGGMYLEIPVSHYTVTYLYRDTSHNFIRGYHGILHNAFYLPEVFLEHTFNNGHWITKNDTKWKKGNIFNLSETFSQLNIKASMKLHNTFKNTKLKKTKKNTLPNYKLYSSNVIHYQLSF